MFSRSWGKISTAIGALAFVQTATEADMHGTEMLPVGDRAKVLVNSLTGRLFGFGVVPNAPHPPQTFNFGGIFNKFSGLGAGLYLLGKSGMPIPHRGKASTLGRSLLVSGILGGFFSGSSPSHTHTVGHPVRLSNFQLGTGGTMGGV